MPSRNIEIVLNGDELNREVYNFILDQGLFVYFNSYFVQRRITKRHKWATKDNWQRLDKRDSTIQQVYIPVTVKEQLKKIIIEMVQDIEIVD